MTARVAAAIMRANALLIPLASASVDLIIMSPPYFAFRSYRDNGEHYEGQIGSEAKPSDFLVALWWVMDECWRVLKPTGVCFVNLGDKYAGSGGHNNGGIAKPRPDMYGNKAAEIDAVTAVIASRRQAPDRYNQSADVPAKSVMGLPWRFALGLATPNPYRTIYDPERAQGEHHPQWINRRPMVWHKPNGLPESVTDRAHLDFEDWFMFVKQGSYFSAVDELRVPHAPKSKTVSTMPYRGEGTENAGGRFNRWLQDSGHERELNPLGAMPGSVWTIASEPLVVPLSAREKYNLPDHFAAFPQEWPRRLILGWSPSGVCRACGEGRRPAVIKEASSTHSRGRRHVPGYEDPAGEGTRDVAYEIVGQVCACTPRTSNRGKRGDWKDGREPEAEKGSDDYHSPGMSVPRRPGGFGTKVPPPSTPMWEYHLEGWDPAPTDPAVVLDPFAGTGTVLGVARALGRTGVGLDLSADYCRLAKWRVERSGHFAKTTNRTNAERQGALQI